MPRPLRASDGGVIYHVLNRANARTTIFATDADYAAFEKVLGEGCEKTSTRIIVYCLTPNHWHLVLRPQEDRELSRFMCWVTMTHTQRWHAAHETVGQGHLYQGRFKSFPVQGDQYFHILCRYVESNPLRAGLVERAEDWRWCSLHRRLKGNTAQPSLADWPMPCPTNWLELVNDRRSPEEANALRASILRGRPFGSTRWTAQTAARFGLQSTLRPRGRPWPQGGQER